MCVLGNASKPLCLWEKSKRQTGRQTECGQCRPGTKGQVRLCPKKIIKKTSYRQVCYRALCFVHCTLFFFVCLCSPEPVFVLFLPPRIVLPVSQHCHIPHCRDIIATYLFILRFTVRLVMNGSWGGLISLFVALPRMVAWLGVDGRFTWVWWESSFHHPCSSFFPSFSFPFLVFGYDFPPDLQKGRGSFTKSFWGERTCIFSFVCMSVFISLSTRQTTLIIDFFLFLSWKPQARIVDEREREIYMFCVAQLPKMLLVHPRRKKKRRSVGREEARKEGRKGQGGGWTGTCVPMSLHAWSTGS